MKGEPAVVASVTGAEAGDGGGNPGRLSVSDRLLPLVLIGSIGVGLGVAQVVPAVARSLGPMVDLGVFLLIFLVMLGLDLGGLRSVFAERRFLSLAVGLNFVVNPLLAFGIGRLFLGDQPDLRIGLLLFLVTPCVGWYLIFTQLAGGDVELGVGLLGVNVVLQVLLLPAYLLVFEGQASGIGAVGLVESIVMFLVIPAALAWCSQRGVGRLGRSLDDITSAVDAAHAKTVLLAIVIIAMFASQAETVFDNLGVMRSLFPPMVMFFGVSFGLALVAARLGGLSQPHTALLAFTVTSRNSEASLAIAATAFASPLVALTVVVGPVVELPLLVLMVRVLRRRSALRLG